MSERTYIEVIMVEPLEAPKVIQLQDSLEAMQEAVQGNIEEYMPFPDEVAIICNEDGKCTGMPLNRGIFDENGQLVDIIAGPFFIAYAPIESENFLSLPEDLREKYMKRFRTPEVFVRTQEGIKAVPYLTKEDLER
jgi:hypothetical protein